eukprot:8787010-Alexandrium_andersonii.AAC.1
MQYACTARESSYEWDVRVLSGHLLRVPSSQVLSQGTPRGSCASVLCIPQGGHADPAHACSPLQQRPPS